MILSVVCDVIPLIHMFTVDILWLTVEKYNGSAQY